MYLVNNLSNKYADLSHLMQLVGVLKSPLSPLRTCAHAAHLKTQYWVGGGVGGCRGRLPWAPGGYHYTNEDFM